MNIIKLTRIILIIIFSILSFYGLTQNKYSERELDEMVRTYSFYLGQKFSVDKIVEKFPSLRPEITEAQNLWSVQFKSSVENINKELIINLGTKFDELEKALYSNLLSQDFSSLSISDSKDYIDIIRYRTQGNIPSPFLETLLSFKPSYQKSPEKEYLDGFIDEYYTKESLKSQGLNLKIKYPKSWLAKNGDRPHVLKKMTSNNGHGLVGVLIGIAETNEIPTESDINLLLSEDGMKYQLPENFKVISTKTGLTIDNFKAASITYYFEKEQMDIKLGIIMETYMLYYNNFQISLVFSVGSTSDNYTDIANRYEINKKLFWHIANDIVIISQYE